MRKTSSIFLADQFICDLRAGNKVGEEPPDGGWCAAWLFKPPASK